MLLVYCDKGRLCQTVANFEDSEMIPTGNQESNEEDSIALTVGNKYVLSANNRDG